MTGWRSGLGFLGSFLVLSGLASSGTSIEAEEAVTAPAQAGRRSERLIETGRLLRKAQLQATPSPGVIVLGLSGRLGEAQSTEDTLRLSLKQAGELALKQNWQLQIANLRVLESRGFFQALRSAYLPQFNARLNESYQSSNLRGLGLTFPGVPEKVNYQSFDVRPGLSQTLLDLGLWRSIDAARARIQQAEWDAASLREATLLMVVQLYLQAQRADSNVTAVEARLRTAEALLKQVRDFLEAGTASRLDEARADVEFQNATRNLAETKRERDTARLLLLKAIGTDIGQKVELTDKLGATPSPSGSAAELLVVALGHRPEMKALEAKLRAAELEKKKARAGRYPTASLAADLGRSGPSMVDNVTTYSVRGTVNVPIYLGGRVEGEIQAAESRIRQVEQEIGDTKSQIQLDVHTALVQLEAARQSVDAAQKAVKAAQTRLELSKTMFEAGASNNIDVTQAQEILATAQDNELRTLFDYQLARANLARAQGDILKFLE